MELITLIVAIVLFVITLFFTESVFFAIVITGLAVAGMKSVKIDLTEIQNQKAEVTQTPPQPIVKIKNQPKEVLKEKTSKKPTTTDWLGNIKEYKHIDINSFEIPTASYININKRKSSTAGIYQNAGVLKACVGMYFDECFTAFKFQKHSDGIIYICDSDSCYRAK